MSNTDAKEFKTMYPVDSEGWSEWVSPDHSGYLFKCCDCGLVHEMRFAVVRYDGAMDENGLSHCDYVDDPDVQAVFKARRMDEELHYLVAPGPVDFSAGSEARWIIERVENEEISASKACELICELMRKNHG